MTVYTKPLSTLYAKIDICTMIFDLASNILASGLFDEAVK